MPIRVTRGAGAVLLVGALVAACGGGSSGNGVASKPPNQIVTAASNAISHASTVHVAGSIQSGGTPLSLDLSLVSGKGGQGVMSENGLTFRIVAVGQNVYIQGTPAFWQHFGGARAAQLLDGKWLKAPATARFAPIASLTNLQELFNRVLLSHGALKKGSIETVNGQKAIAVHDTTAGGTLYVATTGQPYPVEVSKRGAGAGRIVFDRINQPVSLSPPANALDISKLR
jgi:hypothetical protein